VAGGHAVTDLDPYSRMIQRLGERVDSKPVFRWATVTSTSPLLIQLDGDPAPLLGSPSNAGPKIYLPGERVRVELQNGRATIHTAASRVENLRGTSAQRVALAMSGAVAKGMRFYDEDEDIEYQWVGSWAAVLGPVNPLTINGGTGTCYWQYVDNFVHFYMDVVRTAGSMAGDFAWDPVTTIPEEARPTMTAALGAWGGSVRLASSTVRTNGTVLWRQESSTSTNRAVAQGVWPRP
jgi:hypothetical protein